MDNFRKFCFNLLWYTSFSISKSLSLAIHSINPVDLVLIVLGNSMISINAFLWFMLTSIQWYATKRIHMSRTFNVVLSHTKLIYIQLQLERNVLELKRNHFITWDAFVINWDHCNMRCEGMFCFSWFKLVLPVGFCEAVIIPSVDV